MWICPRCSRENGNSFNSCKSCGYIISEKEKSRAIEDTKRKIENYNGRALKNQNGYHGPRVEYDEDDSYFEDYYTDDMFDDDYEKRSKKSVIIPIVVILLIFALGAGVVYYLNSKGYINWFNSTDFVYTESADGITITGYNGSDTTLEIPDIIEGNTVTAIGKAAFENSNLKSVSLPDTLRTIGERAFFDNKSLHVIDIKDGLVSISDYAFASCPTLEDTFIPDSVKDIGKSILKDSGSVYIQAVPGSKAMNYAIENSIDFTPMTETREIITVTPIRTDDKQIYTTSSVGYGVGNMFSFMPYKDSKYRLSVEASIEGYLKIDDFGTMGSPENVATVVSKNHVSYIDINLKKEQKYYFAIINEGTEENKNIEFAMKIEAVTDKQTKAEETAKNWVGKMHSFAAYNDIFYDDHSESGDTHYLEWNTNKQSIVDYYIESNGTLWVAINAPGSDDDYSEENGNYNGFWWHKVEE